MIYNKYVFMCEHVFDFHETDESFVLQDAVSFSNITDSGNEDNAFPLLF